MGFPIMSNSNRGYPYKGRGGGGLTREERIWRELVSSIAEDAPNVVLPTKHDAEKFYLVDPSEGLPSGIWLKWECIVDERCQLCGCRSRMWIIFYKPSKHIFPVCIEEIQDGIREKDISVQRNGEIETYLQWAPDLS